MRMRVTIMLVVLSAALIACAAASHRSKRAIASDVQLMLVSLIFPMVGNLIIILSSDWLFARIGCYVYYLGMDWTVATLLRFTADYCGIRYRGTVARKVINAIILIDVVQLLLNPFFGHAFSTEQIMIEGAPYYALVPFAGQAFHRVVAYGVFFVSVAVFVYKTVTAPRIYVERYLVILLVMVFTGAWESYYIFSGSPIDRSMIGFGVFGLLVFYFALYYKPMRLLDRMLARIVSDMDQAVLFFDRDHKCIYANASAHSLFGIQDESALEASVENLATIVGEQQFGVQADWSCERVVRETGQPSPAGTWAVVEDGSVDGLLPEPSVRFWSVEHQVLHDSNGRLFGSYLAVRDRTEEERQLRSERYNATHDELTGLYNKQHLYEVAARAMERDPDTVYCAVALDVREFKLVNDIFGKELGDEVLCSIGRAIRKYARPNEVFGRISGDKFGYFVPADQFDSTETERHFREERLLEDDINYPIVIHMGVHEVLEADLPISVMFDRAFMAISTIKNDHSRHIAFYDDAMREEAIWNQKISAELDGAIAQGQIVPYLQPLVDDEGEVEGAEMLARWLHPEEGLMSPVRFIPYFEENGRIAQLDVFMWESACQLLKRWEQAGIDKFLSVNISPKDFYFLDVHEVICDLVQKYQVNPEKLRLEITETVMMSDVQNRLRIIEELRSSGFMVEMDDFGSGYSSLNMLKDIPVDMLKIDMMFLYQTKDQKRAQTILQTIIDLSRELGIPSITEGVETAEQVAMLLAMGCRLFQGYYFSKPMPAADFENAYCSAA